MIASARMTGAQFDALPEEEGRQWELVEGDLIEVSSASAEHQKIAARILVSLWQFFRSGPMGGVLPDVEFAMGSNVRLCPDLSILLGYKWQTLNDRVKPIPLSPDIAVEVISPSERTVESARKVRTYLKEGASEVWQIFPETSEVLVYRTGPSITILAETQSLETPLLPGWSLPLRELFPASEARDT